MRLSAANVRELITEDQHPAAQLLQPLRNGRYGAGDQCGQLFDFSFQLPQQRIVCLDLPVQFATVRDNAPALQRLRCRTLMDGRNLIQTPCSVTSVVNAFVMPVPLQVTVGRIRPRCSP